MADLTEYKPRQATETWLEYLGRQGPEAVSGVAKALMALPVRAPGMARALTTADPGIIGGIPELLAGDATRGGMPMMRSVGNAANANPQPQAPMTPQQAEALLLAQKLKKPDLSIVPPK